MMILTKYMGCPAAAGISAVVLSQSIIPNLNVAENIMLPFLLDGKKMRDYKKPLKDILEVVGLPDKRLYTPRKLSGG